MQPMCLAANNIHGAALLGKKCDTKEGRRTHENSSRNITRGKTTEIQQEKQLKYNIKKN